MDERSIPLVAAAIGAFGVIIASIITVTGKNLGIRSARVIGLVGIVLVTTAVIIAYLLLRAPSIPSAHIERPGYADGPVPVQTSVVVKYEHIPKRRYLWVVVRVPEVKPDWVVFPQLLSGMPTPVEGTGTYETTIQLGDSQKDVGKPFNIVVLLLNDETNRSFVEYSKNCLNLGVCGGIQLPDSGAQILDFNTVTRK